MNTLLPPGFWFVISSIYIACILAIFPLSDWLAAMRPVWILLMVIYWVRVLPSYLGLWFAFLVGFACDVLLNKTLGSHGLALVLVVYLQLLLQRQIQMFSTLQQVILVLVFSFIYLLTLRVVEMFFGYPVEINIVYWLPALINALLWPWFCFVMDGLKIRLGIYETNH